jgi:hypothetical protein
MHSSPVRAWIRLAQFAAISFAVVLASSHLFSIAAEYLQRRTGFLLVLDRPFQDAQNRFR